jgi:hypothetical protein
MELNVPLLGMTFHQNPLSGGLKSAECQAIWMEQKMMSCGGNIVKKTTSSDESVDSDLLIQWWICNFCYNSD